MLLDCGFLCVKDPGQIFRDSPKDVTPSALLTERNKMESANINNQPASSTTWKFKSVRSQLCKINCTYSRHVSV